MRYFDVHLHLPSPDSTGLGLLLRHLENEPGLVGGNLILNSVQEVEFVIAHRGEFPESLNLIPLYSDKNEVPDDLKKSGWFKIHPRLHHLDRECIDAILESVCQSSIRPAGFIVDCYPWGIELKYNISLELVIRLATVLPETKILATHGGGYLSWEFRAHTGSLKNVIYDFSHTLSYYQGSDILRPLQRYLRYSQNRVLFGSDWPGVSPTEQLSECIRLAAEVEISSTELEHIFLENSRSIWPHPFTVIDA